MMGKAKLKKLEQAFKEETETRGAELDPNNEFCWLSLAVGWAVAKGLSARDARDFAGHIRYETDLGWTRKAMYAKNK